MSMTMTVDAMTARPTLRVIQGGAARGPAPWWERRATQRTVVGGCPDHWWKPTAARTAECTCDRF
jgi:hypothetical protein